MFACPLWPANSPKLLQLFRPFGLSDFNPSPYRFYLFAQRNDLVVGAVEVQVQIQFVHIAISVDRQNTVKSRGVNG